MKSQAMKFRGMIVAWAGFAAGVAGAGTTWAQTSSLGPPLLPKVKGAPAAPVQPITTPAPIPSPAPAPAPLDPALDKKLTEIDARIGEVKDLTADYEQAKKTPLLKKPLITRGSVKVKGQRTKWETTGDHPTIMTSDPAELRIYYPQQKTVEVYPIDAGMSKMAASPLPRLKDMREQFAISAVDAKTIDPKAADGEIGLKLTPLKDSLREHVSQVLVLLDPVAAFGRTVSITSPEGDVTTLTFTNIRTGVGLSDEVVKLETPRGTLESRPLQGQGPTPAGDAPK